MNSTRLPGKVLKKIKGVPLLEWQLRRVKLAKMVDKTVVATGAGPLNDPIEKLCKKVDVYCFRGSEDDVLDRFYACSRQYPEYKIIVRLTGDCPLTDPGVIDFLVTFFKKNTFDYVSNVGSKMETFPDGLDVEVFSAEALAEAAKGATRPSDREHVTPWIKRSKKLTKHFPPAPYDFSHIRLTVDEPEDFEVVQYIIESAHISDEYPTLISILTKRPDVMMKNMHVVRNEGYANSLKKEKKGKAAPVRARRRRGS